MRRRDGFGVEDFTIGRRAAMKIRAVPGGDAIGSIMRIVLRHVDPPSDNIRRADPVDAAAFRHRGAWLDYASTRLDPVTWVDMAVAGAICQGKTKARASRNRRKASHCRACPTPHRPPSPWGNYRMRAWSECGKTEQARVALVMVHCGRGRLRAPVSGGTGMDDAVPCAGKERIARPQCRPML